jgi:hypothetical protein
MQDIDASQDYQHIIIYYSQRSFDYPLYVTYSHKQDDVPSLTLTSKNNTRAAVMCCGMKEEEEKVKRCPICGCTEHMLIGCVKHWAKHKEGPDGRCVPH